MRATWLACLILQDLIILNIYDRLCDLVARVPGYKTEMYVSCEVQTEAVGMERGPLSLVSTTEELLEGKSSGSDLENRE
jgi:hypothetical protein